MKFMIFHITHQILDLHEYNIKDTSKSQISHIRRRRTAVP